MTLTHRSTAIPSSQLRETSGLKWDALESRMWKKPIQPGFCEGLIGAEWRRLGALESQALRDPQKVSDLTIP